MTHEERMKLPLHQPQGRPIVRTKNPIRPAWLDGLRRPIRIVALTEWDYMDFLRAWRFDNTEGLRIHLVGDLSKLPIPTPLLVLPGGEDESSIPDFCPVTYWRRKGGPVITIPDCAVRNTPPPSARKLTTATDWAHFPLETNMCAETVIAIAERAHLDSLNGA